MRGFTTTNKSIVNVLQNVVLISKSSIINSKEKNEENQEKKFIATWDTGATNTMISENVVNQCGLVSTGATQVGTAGGVVIAYTYVIDLVLPDNMVIKGLNVTCGKLNDTDVLIGMDIMSTGDFAVSNYEGQTKFTFRVPSLGHSDYVRNSTIRAENRPSRNSLCPCRKQEEIQKLLWKKWIK